MTVTLLAIAVGLSYDHCANMTQHYLIIGNGRLARHFQHYFSLLGLSFSTWNRQESHLLLEARLKSATHILLLIADEAIEIFAQQYLQASKAYKIHCSGSLISEVIIGAHPLQSFNRDVYDLNRYQAVPFVIDHDAPDFAALFPGLPNTHVRLHKSKKAKYHALCVLSGNFSCILWQKMFSSLEQEMGLPASIAHAYLQQQTENLLKDYKSALTGPLVRHDQKTITNNIEALNNDPLQEIYKNFVKYYRENE